MALTLVVPTGEIVRTLTVYKGDKKMHQNSNHRARKTGTGCNRGRVPDEPDHPVQRSAETTCAGCKETQSCVQHPAGPTTALRSRRVALLSGSTPARSFSGVPAVQGSSLKKKKLHSMYQKYAIKTVKCCVSLQGSAPSIKAVCSLS